MAEVTLTDELSVLSARLADLSPALDRAGALMHESVMDNFAAQGRPEAWTPKKTHGPILFETGRLMSSIVFSANANSLTVTAPVPYARVQQEGTPRIPARPFLLIQQADVAAIVKVVGGYLSGRGAA